MPAPYLPQAPNRDEIDAQPEPLMVEFGTDWCGHCAAARSHIAAALTRYPQVRHLKVEDGPGRRLGRSFHIKLWPTLVFLSRGEEVARLVRPDDSTAIEQALDRLVAAHDAR